MLSHQSCWNVFSSNAHFKPLKRPWFCYCRYCHLIQFSCSIMSDSLQPHGLQDARLSCLWPTPGACSNSCQSSRWCHPTVSSSVIPLSSCLQSFPPSRSFPVSQFFASCDQSIGASVSASVLLMNIQDWSPLGLTDLISLLIFPSKLVIVNKRMKSVKRSSHVRIK